MIPRKTYEQIREILSKDPTISNRELARRTGIGKDAAGKWRLVDNYEDPEANQVVVEKEELTAFEEHRLKRENQRLKKQVADLLDEQDQNARFNEFVDQCSDINIKVPKWKGKLWSKGKDTATVVAMASDWHLDEHISLEQVNGVNEYNRKIAEVRVGQFFDHLVRIAQTFVGGINYDGLYLLLGGDLFSGNIHQELEVTNEATIFESLIYWAEPISSGIKYLADSFGNVHIPCVVGNHGRRTFKPIHKNRVQDNFDWAFYNILRMNLQDDHRITWDISPSADCVFTVHDHTFLFTHGDQFRGGSGIAGSVHPWLLGNARKLKAYTGMGMSYDTLILGHWHQLSLGIQGIMVNGSLCGYNEFAMHGNFPFEPPQQAFWLVQPQVGITGRWPIHVLGDDEKYLDD